MPPDSEGTSIAPNGLSDPCPDDPSRPVNMSMRAAAVAYRRTPQGIEFLLVRTRNRRAWTFPKGHIEQGESPGQAAQREAREEAAVSGRVDLRPFTRYRYPTMRVPGVLTDVCVEAYLLEVDASGPGQSVERPPPAWLAPADAARKLAQGRTSTHAREHRRVLREALARLQASEPKHERALETE
jgi:8-oxo-dGTP pyrophosphatase MutT (NUDIX family)